MSIDSLNGRSLPDPSISHLNSRGGTTETPSPSRLNNLASALRGADVFEVAPTRIPDPPPPNDPINQINQLNLTNDQKQSLRDAVNGKFSARAPSAQASVESILASIANQSVDVQDKLMSFVASDVGNTLSSAYETADIARCMTSESYARMTQSQVGQLCLLLSTTNSHTTSTFFDNMNTLTANPLNLFSLDKDGNNLLSNLSKLAEQKLNPSLQQSVFPFNNIDNADVLASAVSDVAQPTAIQQCDYNSCTVTSMEYAMAKHYPSEYVRLIAGLSGQSGSASMRGGDSLKLQGSYYTTPLGAPDDLRPPSEKNVNGDQRSVTNSMFQGAAMSYAQGVGTYLFDPGASYNPVNGEAKDPGFGPWGYSDVLNAGVGDQQTQVLDKLFGKDNYNRWFTDHGGWWGIGNNVGDQLSFLKGYHNTEPALMGMKLPDGKGHELCFDHIENDRMYFFNPWGNGKPPSSKFLPGEGSDSGLVSISFDDFKSTVTEIDKR